MEKKYLVGYIYGQEAVMWDDVKDFIETIDPDTNLTAINFKENDIEYTYIGNENRGYTEINNKAPFITSYKLMGRRTAIRHDYFNKDRREAPDDYDDYSWSRYRRSSCGGGCGGEADSPRRGYSSCGGVCGGGGYHPCGGYSSCGGGGC